MNTLPFSHGLGKIVHGHSLSRAESRDLFAHIFNGELEQSQLAGVLMALATKKESREELVGAVDAMRSNMVPFSSAPEGAIDVCGTGGDKSGSLNISTAVAFVVAGAGVAVAKHGNRAQTSKSGAADTLEALGVNLDADIRQLERAITESGTAFLMAPRHHPSMRHVAPVRKALGVRTIFNMMGPLCNPARVKRQLVGVFAPDLTTLMAQALCDLGSEKAWVVHGDGLDELSIAGESQLSILENGTISSKTIHPENAGLPIHKLEAIAGGDAQYNCQALQALLDGAPGAYRDAVMLNASAALIVAGKTDSLEEGVAMALESITSGRAKVAMESLVAISNGRA